MILFVVFVVLILFVVFVVCSICPRDITISNNLWPGNLCPTSRFSAVHFDKFKLTQKTQCLLSLISMTMSPSCLLGDKDGSA